MLPICGFVTFVVVGPVNGKSERNINSFVIDVRTENNYRQTDKKQRKMCQSRGRVFFAGGGGREIPASETNLANLDSVLRAAMAAVNWVIGCIL